MKKLLWTQISLPHEIFQKACLYNIYCVSYAQSTAPINTSSGDSPLLQTRLQHPRLETVKRNDTVTYVFGLTDPVYNSITATKPNYLQQEFQQRSQTGQSGKFNPDSH